MKREVKKRIRHNGGFTLIEMIIATALVAVFFSMAVTVLPTWFQSYKEIIDISYARQISGAIVRAVESQVMFADHVEETGTPGIIQAGQGAGMIQLPSDRSSTPMIEGLVYDEKFYRGMQADVFISVTQDEYCTVTVTMSDEGGNPILKKERCIRLVGAGT